MNKSAFKIFIGFTVISAFIATILLVINFIAFAIIGSDTSIDLNRNYPEETLKSVSKSLEKSEDGFILSDSFVFPQDFWCILINENGDIIWSKNKPDDIPSHYSINDIAKITRWFLNDYPVYVSAEDYGLIILGIPKNAVGKYYMEYSMEWFSTLPQRLIGILIVNLLLAAVIAFILGISLYRHISVLTNGIRDLRCEKDVKLNERGIFKELARNINSTSAAIARKNAALGVRETARLNWISGISHDIRTPLAIVIGNSEALENSPDLNENDRKRARAVTSQSIKIKKLREDLNLISSLEYDMQPLKQKSVRLCPFIRRIVSNIINSGLSDNYEIEMKLENEKTTVSADEFLLERAVFNLINNSITHNKNGCKIRVESYTEDNTAYIVISDNGSGVSEDILAKISQIPKTAHGLGLPMAYKIISVHGGKMSAKNNNGFSVTIKLPAET